LRWTARIVAVDPAMGPARWKMFVVKWHHWSLLQLTWQDRPLLDDGWFRVFILVLSTTRLSSFRQPNRSKDLIEICCGAWGQSFTVQLTISNSTLTLFLLFNSQSLNMSQISNKGTTLMRLISVWCWHISTTYLKTLTVAIFQNRIEYNSFANKMQWCN